MFRTERRVPASVAAMRWRFPVRQNLYEVRLYFAEIFPRAQRVGARTFDVVIQGDLRLQDYDVYAEVGADRGVVKSFVVFADDTLEVELVHGRRNPSVHGIEVVPVYPVQWPPVPEPRPTPGPENSPGDTPSEEQVSDSSPESPSDPPPSQGTGPAPEHNSPGGSWSQEVVARDTFERAVQGSWGKADVGGPWVVVAGSTSNFSVDGSGGSIVTPSGSNEQVAHLGDVSVRDVDVKAGVTFTTLPPSSNYFAYVLLRHQPSGGTHYRIGPFVGATGRVFIRGQDQSHDYLFSDVDTGVTVGAGEALAVRVQMEGTNPTTIRAKVWRAAAAEPASWAVVAADATRELQGPGSIGVRTISTSGTPASIRFGHLVAWAAEAEPQSSPSPSPSPSPSVSPSPSPSPSVSPSPSPSCNGVAVEPADDVQAKLSGASTGATLCFAAGTYKVDQAWMPRSGQKLIAEPGAVLDGRGTTPAAIATGGTNVTVQGFIVQNFAAPVQKGVIDSRGGGFGWVIRDNEVRNNLGVGICVSRDAKIINNYVHHNGQMGMCGAGADILVEGNEIAYNNTDPGIPGWKRSNPGWEAGGFKFVYTRDLVVRGNYSHNNDGPGLWTDVNNIYTLYEDNLVEDNSFAGIFHEVSYDAVIRNNVVRRNGLRNGYWRGGAGILVANSSNVEIYNNVVEDNGHGIGAIQTDRSAVPESFGPREVENLYVHHNTIRQIQTDCAWQFKPFGRCQGYTGLYVGGMSGTPYYTIRNNRFENNSYVLEEPGPHFWWDGDWRTVAGWRSYGNDVNGSFNSI